MRYIITFMMMFGLSPLLTSAATYWYVDTQGEIGSVEAATADEALVTATDRAPNSGVAIDQGFIEPDNDNIAVPETTYHYVTSSGFTAAVEASSATVALSTAPGIDSHSGVAIDQGYIEPGMVVPSVIAQ